MKFQDDISNMNTYIHTYVRTSRNQYAPPLFQSWGHNELILTPLLLYTKDKKTFKLYSCLFCPSMVMKMELVYIYRPIISIYRTIETIAILKTLLPILSLLPYSYHDSTIA